MSSTANIPSASQLSAKRVKAQVLTLNKRRHLQGDVGKIRIFGLSACTGVVRQPTGIVRANPSSRALLLDTMREVVDVARARGVTLDPAYAEKRFTFIDGLPEDMRASMAVDLERGNRLELPWLSGGVMTLGEQCGVATPVNRVIAAALAPYVDGAPKAHVGG